MINFRLLIAIIVTISVPPGILYSTLNDNGLPPLAENGCGQNSNLVPKVVYVDTTSFFGFATDLKNSLNRIIHQQAVGTRFEIWANIHQLNGAGPSRLYSFCIPPRTRDDAIRIGVEAGGDKFYSKKADAVERTIDEKISALVELVEARATAWNSPLLESLVYFLHRDYHEMILMSDAFHLTKSRQFCETKSHMVPRDRTQLLKRESLDPAITAGKRLHWVQVVVPGRQEAKPHCVEEEATSWFTRHFEIAELDVRYDPVTITRKPELN